MANSTVFSVRFETPVVNCFQISNFVLWQTAKFIEVNESVDVVNCFQISNFVLWQTAFFFETIISAVL